MTPEERAHAAANLDPDSVTAATRRLSWVRVLGLVVAIAAAAAGVVGFRTATRPALAATVQSDFMPYVDVTATPQYPFEDASRSASANMVLGFVVSSRGDACTPSWGGAYSLDEAATSMDVDRRIARLRQRGGQVAISFGGEANSELADTCTDPARLLAAYRSVVRRYSVNTIDLDIEGAGASRSDAVQRRATAIRALQLEEQHAKRTLAVWLTLPVDPSGLTRSGRAIVARTLAADVTLAGVNGLTMDYGGSLAAGRSTASAYRSAVTGLAAQLTSLYAAAGRRLAHGAEWQLIGATPMIGQNDVAAERFELADARSLVAFAQAHHLRRLSMWSVNRDQACGPNYANASIVSDNCSGVDQRAGAFTAILASFRATSARTPKADARPAVPTSGTTATSIVDDPASSPYEIWNPELPYAHGTKVVWHHNVYEAKWWTEGDTPDAPVAASTDTPWTLIGPVLPGEHPAPTPTVSAGTYPQWSAAATYRAGARVVYDGVGYQAKWYSVGDVPGIVVGDAGKTPWQLITHA
ncbi:MAG TPA: hypothetical protein VGN18_15905 [Jatrophihabitans sp.]|jgi:chitinase|uniref:chitinase n=1 Tax=Jatrophihabitans sp. TaxID=1932789 RepID=UPI002E0777AD|nr:hypothetical protein [Jatrophihabitans sp.]